MIQSDATARVHLMLAARLEARAAILMASHAKRLAELAPAGAGGEPSRMLLQSAERAMGRASRRLAEARRGLDLLA